MAAPKTCRSETSLGPFCFRGTAPPPTCAPDFASAAAARAESRSDPSACGTAAFFSRLAVLGGGCGLNVWGVGFSAIALLLKLPAVPNCPAIFWPTASASMRLYCAQVAANKQTAADLLEAIALVEALPKDHPLRPEIERNIEQWSLDILTIGEEKFQAGQLDEAIAIAKRIPTRVAAYKLVEERVAGWQSVWSKAEGLYKKAEEALKQSNWNLAFREAIRLTGVDNKFWATTKYEQLVQQIQIAKAASEQLDKAHQLSRTGRVKDLLEAIKQAEKIPANSYAYKEAQDLIAASGEKLLAIAQNRLKERNWEGVLEITDNLPASVKSPELKSDLSELARALSLAATGAVTDLEEAIAVAQKLGPARPLYAQGQQLATRWQREIQDVTQLERARTFAGSGLVSDLRLAIAEAQQVPQGNPRYQEARDAISRWVRQVETIEDRPYIDRATQVASFGSVSALQEAVQEASRVAQGRALYSEAQGKIGEWTRSIQRQQDQPYLNQARALARAGNLPAAIAAAQQIKSGRVLAGEAQRDIQNWQAELQGRQRLQEAYQAANGGTPQALLTAIRLAGQVPDAATGRGEATVAANRWGYQLLSLAQDRARLSLTDAIAIARLVPTNLEAYATAQQQIQTWQASLQPPTSPQVGTDAPFPLP